MNQDERTEEATPERIGLYYDEWTPRYQASFGNTFQACRPTAADDLHGYILDSAGISDGEHILDAGCGVCGPSMYFAARRDIRIDAVTVSQAQVATARQLIADAGLDRKIAVHLGDFHKLDEYFPRASFDRVFFLESLSHAADPSGPLKAAYEVLKPGGAVYIKDFFIKQYTDADVQRRVTETIARVDKAFVLKTPDIRHTTAVLRDIGFVEHYIRPVGFSTDIAAWADFNQAHDFDLYGGQEPLQWCDWIELRFEKPVSAD